VTEIIRLTPDDVARYRDIRLEALRTEPDAFGSTFETEAEYPLAAFASRLAECAVFGAVNGDELAGVAGFYVQAGPKHAHKGVLWGMFVRPAYRDTRLGRRLVEAVIEHARQHVELLQLTVIADNVAARRLYQRLGFVEYGIERDAAKYRGRYHDDVLMALAFKTGTPEEPTR